MRTINVVVEDVEYERINKRKGNKTWRAFLTEGPDVKAMRQDLIDELKGGQARSAEEVVDLVLSELS